MSNFCLRLHWWIFSRVSLMSINIIGPRKQQFLGLPLCQCLFNFLNISLFVRAQHGYLLSMSCRINFVVSNAEEFDGVPWKSDREKRPEFTIGRGFEEKNVNCKLTLASTKSSYISSISCGREWRWWFGVLKNLFVDFMTEVRWIWNCGIHAIR